MNVNLLAAPLLIFWGGALYFFAYASCGGDGVSLSCLYPDKCMLPIWKYGGIVLVIVGVVFLATSI